MPAARCVVVEVEGRRLGMLEVYRAALVAVSYFTNGRTSVYDQQVNQTRIMLPEQAIVC